MTEAGSVALFTWNMTARTHLTTIFEMVNHFAPLHERIVICLQELRLPITERGSVSDGLKQQGFQTFKPLGGMSHMPHFI